MVPRRNILHAQTLWLAVLDLACLVLAVVIGVAARLGTDALGEYVLGHIDGWIYFGASIVLANFVVGSYGIQITVSRFNLVVNWIFALVVALIVLSITSLAWFELLLGRGVLALAILAYAGLSIGAKGLLYAVLFRSKLFLYRVVILGVGPTARDVAKLVSGPNVLPSHKVLAYLRPGSGDATAMAEGSAVSLDGSSVIATGNDMIEDIVRSLGADLLIAAADREGEMRPYYQTLRRLRLGGIEVIDGLTAVELYSGRIPLDLVTDAWLMQASLEPSIELVRRFKRMFDIVAVVLTGIVLIPVGIVVAFLIKLTAPMSPAIYVQQRVGQFGKSFTIYKFRTMLEKAEKGKAVWAQEDDPRVTRLGRILRKFRLDEIPQLWNILRGEMSIVGPRPEQPELADELEKVIPHYRERENMPPGLTGWAQVRYPYGRNVEDARRKLEFDLYYLKNLSIKLDVQILLQTLRIVLLGKERHA